MLLTLNETHRIGLFITRLVMDAMERVKTADGHVVHLRIDYPPNNIESEIKYKEGEYTLIIREQLTGFTQDMADSIPNDVEEAQLVIGENLAAMRMLDRYSSTALEVEFSQSDIVVSLIVSKSFQQLKTGRKP